MSLQQLHALRKERDELDEELDYINDLHSQEHPDPAEWAMNDPSDQFLKGLRFERLCKEVKELEEQLGLAEGEEP